jgi:hypothetical protein
MIKWLRQLLFGPQKSPYARGRDYALSEFRAHGWEAEERLLIEADGEFRTDFDRGIVAAVRDYRAQQREIVREMRK